MIALLQRVTHADVQVAGERIAEIDRGILALIGVQPADDESTARRLLERLLAYRIFPDDSDRMNRSLIEMGGGLLLVSQFTLAADTRKGNRPGFSTAAAPAKAEALFTYLCERAVAEYPATRCGRFGANMQVALINDGPVTFWLQVDNTPP